RLIVEDSARFLPSSSTARTVNDPSAGNWYHSSRSKSRLLLSLVLASTGSGLAPARGFTVGVISKRRTLLAPTSGGRPTGSRSPTWTFTRIGSSVRNSFWLTDKESGPSLFAGSSAVADQPEPKSKQAVTKTRFMMSPHLMCDSPSWYSQKSV